VRLVFAATTRARQGGVWLIVIGLWVWANFAGAFGLEWSNSWPLILVAAGAMTIWRALAETGGQQARR
jgi:hypothetical protein